MGEKSTGDLQVRKSLLKFLCSGVGDFCATDVEGGQLCQASQMRQADVGDRIAAEAEFREIRQPLQMHQTGIGDIGTQE